MSNADAPKTCRFFVGGIPRPKGSTRSLKHKRTGDVVTIGASRDCRAWEAAVRFAAMRAWSGPPLRSAFVVRALFILPRPKCHCGTGRNANTLKKSAPMYPTTTPDEDKLRRCALDALTGVVYYDDAQVVEGGGGKAYGSTPGVHITLAELSE